MLYALKRLHGEARIALELGDLEVVEDLTYLIYELVLQARNYNRYNHMATRCYFLRPSLVWPEGSAWAQIRNYCTNMSLINFIRVDWPLFSSILANFDPDDVAWRDGFTDATRTQKRPGRPTLLDSADVLALTLAYLTSTSNQKQLEMLFGMTKTSISDMIWGEGIPMLLRALDRMPAAAVRWPTFEEQRENAYLVEMNYGPCPLGAGIHVFGFMDGMRCRCTNPSNIGVQNLFYNGWEGHVNVVNNFVVDPQGRIIDAIINRPGSLNDYTLASSVFMKLSNPEWTLPGYVLAADSGYVSNATQQTVAHLHFAPEGEPVSADARRAYTTWQLTVRKAAEWAMHIVQSLFPRLTVLMSGSSEKRNAIITACVKLNNLIANNMDRNQIKTVYMSALRHDWEEAQAWARAVDAAREAAAGNA